MVKNGLELLALVAYYSRPWPLAIGPRHWCRCSASANADHNLRAG